MNQVTMTFEKRSQTDDVLEHLQEFGSITPMQALNEYGIFRLAARIKDLENQGYIIPREPYKGKGRGGRTFRVTRYLRPDQL